MIFFENKHFIFLIFKIMCSTKLEKRTVKIVKSFLYRNTFDITLLDRYFEEKDVEMTLVFFLHSYICNTY